MKDSFMRKVQHERRDNEVEVAVNNNGIFAFDSSTAWLHLWTERVP